MNIACIAWGSLLWKPAPLKLASGWHPGGPRLPLEFVRVSDDSPEVALVVCEGAREQATYWAWLATGDLDEARAMLGAREKITPARPDWIGSIPGREGAQEDPRIAAWLRAMRIDAAVWTALPAKSQGMPGRVPGPDEVLAILEAAFWHANKPVQSWEPQETTLSKQRAKAETSRSDQVLRAHALVLV